MADAGMLERVSGSSRLIDWAHQRSVRAFLLNSVLIQRTIDAGPEDRSTVVTDSRTAHWVFHARERLQTSATTAGITMQLRAVSAGLKAAYDSSDTRFAIRNWRSIGQESFLYRWLTAEPEPDVIVIDLRETKSAGPILATLDRALGTLIPHSKYATISSLGRQVATSTRAAPIRVLSVLVLAISTLGLLGSVITGSGPGVVLAWLAVIALALPGTLVTSSWDELRETRYFAGLIDAFEPPAPIEPAQKRSPEDEE